jgi:hypothetical protein
MPTGDSLLKQRRIEEVLQILALGGDYRDVRQYSIEQGWGLSDRTLFRYQQRAALLAYKQQEKKREQLLAMHILRRRTIYSRAMESGDLRTALAAADAEAKLQGLMPREPRAAPAAPFQLNIKQVVVDGEDSSKQPPKLIEVVTNGQETTTAAEPTSTAENAGPGSRDAPATAGLH